MSNQTKNPIFWAFVAFVLGIGLGIWGLIKADCIGGPGCWVGSGFLKGAGIALIVVGVTGFFTIGGNKRNS